MSEKDLKHALSWAIEVLRIRRMNPLQEAYLDVIRQFNSGLSIQVVSLPKKEYELVRSTQSTLIFKLKTKITEMDGLELQTNGCVYPRKHGDYLSRNAVLNFLESENNGTA
jgi:hypothetical protein